MLGSSLSQLLLLVAAPAAFGLAVACSETAARPVASGLDGGEATGDFSPAQDSQQYESADESSDTEPPDAPPSAACLATGMDPIACACRPKDAICVELTWDNATDLDLHFAIAPGPDGGTDVDCDGAVDPWFEFPTDCFWFSRDPIWSPQDRTGTHNPHMRRDDVDGFGPEVATLEAGEPGRTYDLAVYVWDERGHGASHATLAVFHHAALAYEVQSPLLKRGDLLTVGSLVATWGTPDVYVEACHQDKPPCPLGQGGTMWRDDGEPCITACYKNHKFFGAFMREACPGE